ncbi:hypothetical protein [Thermococcus onnurineus]|uniref:hypothetical protein n=1 Tax=Thermococcus onnurineus TaxID=342948 RepID=UPI001EE510AF|nr:hypothetical protein [Thermococcus onnurineus]
MREIFPDLEDLDVLIRIFEKTKYAGRLNGCKAREEKLREADEPAEVGLKGAPIR